MESSKSRSHIGRLSVESLLETKCQDIRLLRELGILGLRCNSNTIRNLKVMSKEPFCHCWAKTALDLGVYSLLPMKCSRTTNSSES